MHTIVVTTRNNAHWLRESVSIVTNSCAYIVGVLQVEAMAQLGGIVMLEPEAPAKEQFFFGGIEKCRFRKPVVPGDTLVSSCAGPRMTMTSQRSIKARSGCPSLSVLPLLKDMTRHTVQCLLQFRVCSKRAYYHIGTLSSWLYARSLAFIFKAYCVPTKDETTAFPLHVCLQMHRRIDGCNPLLCR
jgi:hypothetical protein